MTHPTNSNQYPVLTPVEQYPLHGWDYDGKPYACQSGSNQYDWRCPECVAAAATEVAEQRDATVAWRQSAYHTERPVQLSWLVARSRAFGVIS